MRHQRPPPRDQQHRGTYSWYALAPLISDESVQFENGHLRASHSRFSIVLFVPVIIVSQLLGARAWRWLPRRRR